MIVVSLIILGAIVAAGRGLAFIPALALFAVAGVFHGAAFGATIATQESAVGGAVLFGYLLGLGVTQYLIAIGAGKICKTLWKSSLATDIAPRLAGAGVGAIGVFLLLEAGESAVFTALGLG